MKRIEANYQSAGLSDRRRAILSYALKLTEFPAKMQPEDVQALRNVGLADLDILGVAEVTAYYAYVNRIADGLGVHLESDARSSEDRWLDTQI